MCVIIYVPEGQTISQEELLDAWTTNPDGAGYSIQKDGKVYFKRGFMDFPSFENEISPLIGKYNLLLHFRISTSKAVNQVQTHPYKKGNVTLTEGTTNKPVICMNGIISRQTTYKGCNDTMSYIIDHKEAFGNINQDVLNIIESATGAKWAVMTPEQVLLSSMFEEEDGRFYSNKNHLYYSWYTVYSGGKTSRKKSAKVKDIITDDKLRKELCEHWDLYQDVTDFMEFYCSYQDECDCVHCLKKAKTISDIELVLYENWYYDPYDYLDKEEAQQTCCSLNYSPEGK